MTKRETDVRESALYRIVKDAWAETAHLSSSHQAAKHIVRRLEAEFTWLPNHLREGAPTPYAQEGCRFCGMNSEDPCETMADVEHCALAPSATETRIWKNR